MIETQLSPTDLKRALAAWANAKEISITEFAKTMNYTYHHAYGLLRGERSVSAETLGRVLLNYGPKAAAEITELAANHQE